MNPSPSTNLLVLMVHSNTGLDHEVMGEGGRSKLMSMMLHTRVMLSRFPSSDSMSFSTASSIIFSNRELGSGALNMFVA